MRRLFDIIKREARPEPVRPIRVSVNLNIPQCPCGSPMVHLRYLDQTDGLDITPVFFMAFRCRECGEEFDWWLSEVFYRHPNRRGMPPRRGDPSLNHPVS